jgi:hypothetical protein
MVFPNAYKALGIQPGADEQAIKKAYRGLAKRHHPNVNPDDPKAEPTSKKIHWVCDLLKDARETNPTRVQTICGQADTSLNFLQRFIPRHCFPFHPPICVDRSIRRKLRNGEASSPLRCPPSAPFKTQPNEFLTAISAHRGVEDKERIPPAATGGFLKG